LLLTSVLHSWISLFLSSVPKDSNILNHGAVISLDLQFCTTGNIKGVETNWSLRSLASNAIILHFRLVTFLFKIRHGLFCPITRSFSPDVQDHSATNCTIRRRGLNCAAWHATGQRVY
jgi:hypothetical protein